MPDEAAAETRDKVSHPHIIRCVRTTVPRLTGISRRFVLAWSPQANVLHPFNQATFPPATFLQFAFYQADLPSYLPTRLGTEDEGLHQGRSADAAQSHHKDWHEQGRPPASDLRALSTR